MSGGRRPARKRASSDPTPMKETNEGRAGAKEDTDQDHTFPAQYGQACPPNKAGELTGVRQVANFVRVDVISEVGAVCGSAARTDLCGGGQRWLSLPRHGIADSGHGNLAIAAPGWYILNDAPDPAPPPPFAPPDTAPAQHRQPQLPANEETHRACSPHVGRASARAELQLRHQDRCQRPSRPSYPEPHLP